MYLAEKQELQGLRVCECPVLPVFVRVCPARASFFFSLVYACDVIQQDSSEEAM